MSEGIFNLVPSSNKWGKLLFSTFFVSQCLKFVTFGPYVRFTSFPFGQFTTVQRGAFCLFPFRWIY